MTSSTLRKGISFGENGVMNPVLSNPQYFAYQFQPGNYANLNLIKDSGTRWVKIWVHLLSVWPSDPNHPENGILNTELRDQLDYQIALAKASGCGVVLTIHHDLPEWINGSKDPRVMPSNLDPAGPWCAMFGAVAARYSLANPNRPYSGFAYADIVEFCNEPNQTWTANGGDLIGTVATLFKRAKTIVAGLGNSPLVGGPAVADGDPDTLAGNRNYADFTQGVLERLNGNGFYSVGSDSACVWTAHNYSDVTFDHGPDTVCPDRATHYAGNPKFDRFHLRSLNATLLLAQFGWKGWPNASASDPRIFLTEGGTVRHSAAAKWGFGIDDQVGFENYQNFLGYRNLQRLSTDTLGLGCEMFLNYLLITHPNNFDTGLVRRPDDPVAPLAPRPYYVYSYKPFPGRL